MRLSGTRILVTGGSSGIGLGLVRGFLEYGASVVFSCTSEVSLSRVNVRRLFDDHPGVHGIVEDFSKHFLAESTVARAASLCGGPVDVLVNNAATFSRAKLLETERATIDTVLSVNVAAPFMLVRAFASALIEARLPGSIITVSSLSATVARSEMPAYQVSKAALEMLSTSAAYELGKFRIRSNVIAPGLTETEANERQRTDEPDLWARRAAHIPLGRAGVPGDFVGAAVFLASPESAWVTGARIVVDGGLAAY